MVKIEEDMVDSLILSNQLLGFISLDKSFMQNMTTGYGSV